MGSTVELKR